MRSNFNEIGRLIKAGLKRTGLQEAVREKTALALWDEVVGPKTASVTLAERVSQGILYVTCRDSMWAQELHFLRPVIIRQLNEKLGGEIIKEIRLSGRGFRKGDEPQPVEEEAPETYQPGPLSEDEVERIESAASETIDDPDLARKVAKALEAGRKLRKKFE